MSQNYGEVLCQAVDEIVRTRLEGISYDQTILCTIVDDSKREQGIYVVTNNSTTKFEAFSSITNYRNRDNVYVQIPSGDWNQQKIIIAKKTAKDNEPFIYKRPFESLVDITGNLIKDNIDDNLTGLLANSNDHQAITLWTYNINNDALSKSTGKPRAAYTRLGLQAGFKSLISPFYDNDTVYNVTSGDYGLRLIITATDEKTSKEEADKQAEYVLYLNCADMNGNPYDFQSYYTQEKVFDISQIGKIQTMSLEFYQTPGTFKSAEGKLVPYTDFLGNSLPPNLFTDDVYISLGYDTSEFDSEMVYVYTLDSTTYSRSANPLSDNYKEVQLRWIHQQEDGSFKSITANDKMDYEIRWYKYELGHASADEYSGVYWKNLSVQEVINGESSYSIKDEDWKTHNEASATADQRYPQFFTTWLIPDTTLQEERIKAIVLYNGQPYRSNLLVCENEDEVVNKATVDAVQALSINCEDNTYGNYRIYGQGGSLLDNAQFSIIREWKPMFKSSTGGLDVAPTELIEAESIEWIIPTKKTMIEIDKAFLENADVSYEDNDDARIHIKRTGIGVKGNDISGCNLQKYRIKSYYSQSYSDNTIQCKIVKDKITYTAIKELTFGIAGTSGTDCTFIIDFDNGVSAISANNSSAVTVTARLYDYENNDREDLLSERTVTWTWKTYDSQLTHRAIAGEKSYKREIVFNGLNDDRSNYNILQASIPWGDGTLVAYLPIPIKLNASYAYMSGTSQVIYNSAGEILDLFSNPYIIYDIAGNEISSVTWQIKNHSSQESKYTPTIATDTRSGYQYLKPLSFYVENACEKICAVGSNESSWLWLQPILIMQNRYPSAMLNQWDGKLIVDEKGGSIFAPRMAAGMKDIKDGTFSGVVLGNWGDTNSDNSLTGGDTGLYGFDHGEQTYAFKQDGTAFIGKSGAGRIEFDGSEGIIESGAYDAGQGMSINLKEGTINAHQFTLSAGDNVIDATDYLRLTTNVNDNPLTIGKQFWVEWDGTLHATNGSFSGTIDSSKINGATIIGGSIYVPTQEAPSFSVSSTGVLYANGADITGTINATTLNCDNGFIGGWSITADSLKGGNNTVLGSDGSFGNGSSFQVGADGSVNTNGATITGGKIQGASIGIGNGTNYNAFTVDSNGNLSIGSDQFKVTSAGAMTAENATIRGHVEAATGSIGGWNISTGNKDPITGADTETSARGWNALWAVSGSGYYTVLDPSRDNVIAVGIPASYAFNNHNYAQFRITSQGDLIVGGQNAPFKVTQEGVLTATSGTIGGWTIGEDSLSTTGLTLSASTSGAQLSGGSSTARATGSGYWAIKADGSAEFSNLKITGGEITITNNGKTAFAVTSSGELTATSGNIAGWTISADSLTSTNITLSNSATTNAKAINVSNGTFYVQNNGYMFAKSGSIGGWTIGTNSLTSSGNSNIVLSSASTGNAIKVGSNFTVDTSGSITAKAGTIGGWTINSTYLQSVNTCITLYGNAGSATTANAIYIKHPQDDEYFRVQNNGFVEARAGTIGTWNLSPYQLRFNSSNIFHFDTTTGNLTISGKLKASTITGEIEEMEAVKSEIEDIWNEIDQIYNLIDAVIDLIP